MRTLIVDDELMGRLVLRKIMSRHGEVDVAVNGREAVEAYRLSWEANEPFDVILMDILMPELDGREALKEIRRYEDERNIVGRSQVKIVMITAMEDSKNVIGSFKEGAEGYVVKPVTPEKVDAQLAQLGMLPA
jgi:two-component system chemotaxis response regulator CheY